MQERQGDQRKMARVRRLERRDLICLGDYPRSRECKGGSSRLRKIDGEIETSRDEVKRRFDSLS
jgi:hypothetical protein